MIKILQKASTINKKPSQSHNKYKHQGFEDIKKSFDKAESEIYKAPSPDIVGPDPDPKKCICGGSGVIVHGDGHKTTCPYHGKKMSQIIKDSGAAGEFNLGNLFINIVRVKEYTDNLIKLK